MLTNYLISKISYSHNHNENNSSIEISIAVMNAENGWDFENIQIVMSNIISFRFVELNNASSLIIFGAILLEDENCITVDLFPTITKNGLLLEIAMMVTLVRV